MKCVTNGKSSSFLSGHRPPPAVQVRLDKARAHRIDGDQRATQLLVERLRQHIQGRLRARVK